MFDSLYTELRELEELTTRQLFAASALEQATEELTGQLLAIRNKLAALTATAEKERRKQMMTYDPTNPADVARRILAANMTDSERAEIAANYGVEIPMGATRFEALRLAILKQAADGNEQAAAIVRDFGLGANYGN